MEDIKYLDEKTAANNKQDMIVFDLNTPRFADFLLAFSDVLHSSYTDTATDKDVIAREVIGGACYSQRLRCNFNLKYIHNTKKYEFRSIYRDFDGKLVIYVPGSNYNGIQYNRSNDDSVKLIAKYIKQFSYNKFVYDKLLDFTDKSMAEINAKFDEMRRKNNGKLISNDHNFNYTVFRKKLKIKNAILEFLVGHESESNPYRRPYQYFQLIVKYNVDKDKKKDFTVRYNPVKKRYSPYLSQILDTLKFDDEFNNEFNDEWSSENTKSSVFPGFTIGEVKDIYDLMAYKNNVTKNMDKYIDCGYGLSPVELEIYKQFNAELSESVNKSLDEMTNAYKRLEQKVDDVKIKANDEMLAMKAKAIEEFQNNVKKYNAMLSESGCNLQLSREIPDELLSRNTYFT